MRRLLLATVLLPGLGCRSTPPPAPGTDDVRIRQLEARIALLEAQAKTATADDEILALELKRVGLLVTCVPDHPEILKVERQIRALETMRVRTRQDAMRRRLEAERESLLVTYTAEHDKVRRLDAQIAFLKAGG